MKLHNKSNDNSETCKRFISYLQMRNFFLSMFAAVCCFAVPKENGEFASPLLSVELSMLHFPDILQQKLNQLCANQ